MQVINKNNKTIYKYGEHKLSDGVITSIIFFAVAVLLFACSILISFIFLGEAPSFVAGIGISSMICNAASMFYIVLEIYLYKNFHKEIRNMLILQILLFSIWIFII